MMIVFIPVVSRPTFLVPFFQTSVVVGQGSSSMVMACRFC
jgi:hypothetical protein